MNSHEKDRVVVAISSAALGFTLAFVNAGSGTPVTLYVAWSAFALSVITVLVSFDLNAIQLRRTIGRIDAWEKDPRGRPEPEDGNLTFALGGRQWRTVDLVNTASIYLLVAGIVATVAHVWKVS